MYRHFDSRHQKDVLIIHPGEYLTTGDDVIISTVLGSCVSVALHDPNVGVGGLNHFMLTGNTQRGANILMEENARYGIFAMEILVNEILKLGAKRSALIAKVFGGGHVLHGPTTNNIPEANVNFALEYLELERIPITSHDVGGTLARKILFFPQTSRVLLKRFAGSSAKPVEREELSYLERLRREKQREQERAAAAADVTFF